MASREEQKEAQRQTRLEAQRQARLAKEAESVEVPSPRLLEVGVNVNLNGAVQVKKFDIKAGYHFGLNERYDVSNLTQEQAEAFEDERLIELYLRIDPVAQAEFDKLWEQRIESGE